MSKPKYLYCLGLTLLTLTLLLDGCGDARPVHPSAAISEASASDNTATLSQFVTALNNSDLAAALALFSEDGIVEVVNPPYVQYAEQGNVRQLSYDERVTYKGQDWIKAYVFSLINDKFKSQPGYFNLNQAGNRVKWVGAVSFYDSELKMSFEVTLQGDKISQMVASYTDIASLN